MTEKMESFRYYPPSTKAAVIFLIVAAVILVLAVVYVTVPGLDPNVHPANPAAAISTLRTISSTQELYKSRTGVYGNLHDLYDYFGEEEVNPALVKATDPERQKSGYYFRLAAEKDKWSCAAIPAVPGYTGERSFFIDEVGIIRWAPCEKEGDPPAGPDSQELNP